MTWERLESVLRSTGLEYGRQGSYSDSSEYPESFFTFWNYSTPADAFYDNTATVTVWEWDVYYYTRDPSTLYSAMDAFIQDAKSAGFVADGRGSDISSDRPDYVGRMVVLKYIERH